MKIIYKTLMVVIPAIVVITPSAFWVISLQNQSVAENTFDFKIIDVPLGIASEQGLRYETIPINNSADFRECVRLLHGSDAVVFRTFLSRYKGNGEYEVTSPIVIVYFFPYQGYLIVYYEPQE